MNDNGNQPAFATCDIDYIQNGLTKREYFAGLALQGLVYNRCETWSYSDTELVKKAVSLSDELLKALENK